MRARMSGAVFLRGLPCHGRNGGYWRGGCYGCGGWVCDYTYSGCPSGGITCPACQYYDPDEGYCVTAPDC